MTNTGTWNSDLCMLFMGAVLLPMFLYMVLGVALRIKELSEQAYVINVYECPSSAQSPKQKTQEKDPWESGMVSEAVAALVGFGHKKSDARRIVSQLCSSKSYKRSEDIIIDAVKCV